MIIEEYPSFDLAAFIDNADQREPQASGTLTLEDIEQLMESMLDNARSEPEYFLISPETALLLWRLKHLCRLNEVHPLPRQKRRKCVMRKIYARRRKALRRIRQKVQSGAWVDEIGRAVQ
jgi:hypothetical protein